MLIFPAIDIRKGNVVRLYKGLYAKETIYSRDPIAFARHWSEEGAEFLHIVDLDGAFFGESKNFNIIKRIANQLDLKIQVGGGIRDEETINRLLEAGVNRVIMSTKIFADEKFFSRLSVYLRSKIIVSIDCKSGVVLDRGWTGLTNLSVAEAVKKVEDMGVRTIIITDASSDGTLSGPNIALLKETLASTQMDIIAAGGISGLHDIKELTRISNTNNNLQGAIIGKALYEGKIDLKEAISCAKET